ncbi:hypothetical protein V6U90_03520 [Micromonospora sp. CPCC 206060]
MDHVPGYDSPPVYHPPVARYTRAAARRGVPSHGPFDPVVR